MNDTKCLSVKASKWRYRWLILAVVALLLVAGCQPPGGEIKTAAREKVFLSFDADGNIVVRGDGTADFLVTSSGDESGWKIKLTTTTSREAIGGTQAIALSNNATAQEGFRAVRSIANVVQLLAGRLSADRLPESPPAAPSAPVTGTGEPASSPADPDGDP